MHSLVLKNGATRVKDHEQISKVKILKLGGPSAPNKHVQSKNTLRR